MDATIPDQIRGNVLERAAAESEPPAVTDGSALAKVAQFAIGLSRSTKRFVAFGADALMLPLALWTALALKSAHAVDPGKFAWALFWATACGLSSLAALGLYRTVTRFIGVRVIARIAAGLAIGSVLSAVLVALAGGWRVPYSALAIYWAFAVLFIAGSRSLVRFVCISGLRTRPTKKVAIYGAGEAGARLSTFFVSGPDFKPIAFIDDRESLHGIQINGIPVYSPQDLPALVATRKLDRILLAMPSVPRRRRGEILSALEPLGVHVQLLPDLEDIVTGKARIDDLREVDAADLLGRDPVPPNPQLLESCIRGKNVLVTGAGGSIGSELCRQIVKVGPNRLVLCEMSELALYQIERELREELDRGQPAVELIPLLGNAGDRRRMLDILRAYAVETVYHAAAYKHVPIVEHNMIPGIQNNVISTWHAAEAAIESGVETFVLVSTDKAVNPTNVMGASKRLAELVLQGLQERQANTRFCMVRFGNVLDSSGSVVPLFREQIRRGGPVTVTDPQVMRYFMTIPEAAQLVIQAGSMATGGEVFVLDMGQPVRIADLARHMINLMGLTVRDRDHPEGDIEIQYTGLRSGEKLFEELLIGNNVGGTEHPMIMRAMEERLTWTRMRQILEDIAAALEAFDCKRAAAILQEAVLEYRPAEELCDHVWARRAGAVSSPADDGKVTQLMNHRRQPEVAGAARSRQRPTEGVSPKS